MLAPDAARPCCREDANLVQQPDHDVPSETLYRCRVCGARHYLFDAPPMPIAIHGAAIGLAACDVPRLTPQEWEDITTCLRAVEAAEAAKRACVRRILESRGLDPTQTYQFHQDGRIVKQQVN